jgi:hypothetical protein
LSGVNSNVAKISRKIDLEANDGFIREVELGLNNSGRNVVDSWEPNFPGATAVPLFGDPHVDPFSRERTIRDDAVSSAVKFGDCTKRSNGDVEGEKSAFEGTEKSTMGQLFLDIGADIFDTLPSRGMVTGSTSRSSRTDNPDVPAIYDTFNDRHEIPVVPQVGSPGD